MSSPTGISQTGAKNWDPLVKLTHWGIGALVVVNALVVEEGSGWHIWAGYTLAALLAVRLLWGLVGPKEARFSAFPFSPRRALDHIAELRRGKTSQHRSHNPLGALMVYTLWLCLGVIVATGIAMAGPPPANPNTSEEAYEREFAGGERYREDEGEDEDEDEDEGRDSIGGEHAEEHEEEGAIQEIHEIAVNLLYVLIGLHVLGVLFETRRSGRGLVLSMLPGRRGSR